MNCLKQCGKGPFSCSTGKGEVAEKRSISQNLFHLVKPSWFTCFIT